MTDQHINNSNASDRHSNQIIIPRDSFTAFRLKYILPASISKLSTSISLGTIPKPWLLHNTTRLRDVFNNSSNSKEAYVSKTRFANDDQSFKTLRKYLTRRNDTTSAESSHPDIRVGGEALTDHDELPEEYDGFNNDFLDNADVRSTMSNRLRKVYSRTSITSKRSGSRNRANSVNGDSMSLSNVSTTTNENDNHSTFSRFKSFPKVQNKNSIGWSLNDFYNFQNHFMGNGRDSDDEKSDEEESYASVINGNANDRDAHLYLRQSHIETLEETINRALRRSNANFEHSDESQRSNASFVTAIEDPEDVDQLDNDNEDKELTLGRDAADFTVASSTGNSTLRDDTIFSQNTEQNNPLVSIVGGNNLFDNGETKSINDDVKVNDQHNNAVEIEGDANKRLVSFANTKVNNPMKTTTLKRQQGGTKLLRASPEPLDLSNNNNNSSTTVSRRKDSGNKHLNRLIHEGKVHDVINNVDRYISTMNGDVGNAYRHFHKRAVFAKKRIDIEVEKFEHKAKLKRMLIKFQKGKIIQIDKMLVKVIMTDLVINDKTVDNKVIEKWREFIIVARSTGNIDFPIIIQFFKNRQISRDYNTAVSNTTGTATTSEQDNDESNSEDDDDTDDDITDEDTTVETVKKTPQKKSTAREDKRSSKSKSGGTFENKSCEFEIIMGSKDTSVKLFNSLEKSIEIVKKNPKGNETKYILLCQNPSSSIKWLSFFNYILNGINKNMSKTLSLSVPELKLSLTINSVNLLSSTMDNLQNEEKFTIDYTANGYQIPRLGIFDRLIDLISESISKSTIDYHRKNDPLAYRFLNDLQNDKSRLAFALKKYDRLEWILGDSENLLQSIWSLLSSSHELELREIKHEPDHLSSNNLEEPVPIEGFLVKLSNRRGKSTSKFGRHYYKIRYFSTANHLLLFSNFYKGVPSFEEDTNAIFSPSGEILDQEKLLQMIDKRAMIFESNNYPLSADGRHIDWLKPGITESQFETYDRRALSEAERKVYNVSIATRIINLTEVFKIEPVEFNKVPGSIKTAMILTWNVSSESIKDESIVDSCFQIIMSDGTKYKFQACNRQVRDEWVERLREMVVYWTIKKREDIMAITKLKEKNLSISKGSNEYYESLVANESSGIKNWQVIQAATDPLIYNISSFAITKPIIMSGALYQKHRKHKNFRQFYVVLCPGYLILYDMFDRSKVSNIIKSNSYYKYYTSIKLNGSYVYCDKLTGLELIDKEKTFNHGHPGGKSIPRVYVDGWQTAEDESVKYFTIWFGSKRVMYFNRKGGKSKNGDSEESSDDDDDEEEEEDGDDGDDGDDIQENDGDGDDTSDSEESKTVGEKRRYLKTVSRLGVTGNSLVFMARSRQERDLWVSKLNIEIERFSHTEKEEVVLV